LYHFKDGRIHPTNAHFLSFSAIAVDIPSIHSSTAPWLPGLRKFHGANGKGTHTYGGFHKWDISKMDGFLRENLIMDDVGAVARTPFLGANISAFSFGDFWGA
jgi:hypothetical protein